WPCAPGCEGVAVRRLTLIEVQNDNIHARWPIPWAGDRAAAGVVVRHLDGNVETYRAMHRDMERRHLRALASPGSACGLRGCRRSRFRRAATPEGFASIRRRRWRCHRAPN